jgi:drug/metabolite transporter (DMT)-like permease
MHAAVRVPILPPAGSIEFTGLPRQIGPPQDWEFGAFAERRAKAAIYSPPVWNDSLGAILAVTTALAWSAGLIFFRLSGTQLGPIALNLLKNVVALGFFALTLLFLPDAREVMASFGSGELFVLAMSGAIGIAVADTALLYALNRLGVSIIAIIDSCYSPLVIGFSALMLREHLHLREYVGGALILAAVLFVTAMRPPVDVPPRKMFLGLAAAVFAVTSISFAIVYATPVLRSHQTATGLIWMSTVRLAAGTAALVALMPFTPERRSAWRSLVPSRAWKFAVPGAFLGSYLSLICWVGGFSLSRAGVAAILNQTAVIWSMVLAAIFLRERFTKRKFAALALAMAGVVTIQANWGETSAEKTSRGVESSATPPPPAEPSTDCPSEARI